MKAPLRFAFGWVLYVALFSAVAPVVRAVLAFLEGAPLDLALSLTAALVAFIALWWFVLRAFWRWCDAPPAAGGSGQVNFLACDGAWATTADGAAVCTGTLHTYTSEEMRSLLGSDLTWDQVAELRGEVLGLFCIAFGFLALKRLIK